MKRCKYCRALLHGSDTDACSSCHYLRELITENPQRARNVLGHRHLELHARLYPAVYTKILKEAENGI